MASGEKTKTLWQDPAYRQRMSLAHIGNIPTNLNELIKLSKSEAGRKRASELHLRYGTWNKGKSAFDVDGLKFGKDHYEWSGNDVSYRSLHKWVYKYVGSPIICSSCGKRGKGHNIHWANKSGEYKRETDDWIVLCPKCHNFFDKNRGSYGTSKT